MNDLVKEWEKAKRVLDAAKEKETELRKKVISNYWPDYEDQQLSGTKTSEDLRVKAEFKIDYVADKDFEKIEKLISKAPAKYKAAVEAVFKKKFEISVSGYKALPEDVKKVVDKVITTKQGSTQLKLVDKK